MFSLLFSQFNAQNMVLRLLMTSKEDINTISVHDRVIELEALNGMPWKVADPAQNTGNTYALFPSISSARRQY